LTIPDCYARMTNTRLAVTFKQKRRGWTAIALDFDGMDRHKPQSREVRSRATGVQWVDKVTASKRRKFTDKLGATTWLNSQALNRFIIETV
jgi:hypothetical protein